MQAANRKTCTDRNDNESMIVIINSSFGSSYVFICMYDFTDSVVTRTGLYCHGLTL